MIMIRKFAQRLVREREEAFKRFNQRSIVRHEAAVREYDAIQSCGRELASMTSVVVEGEPDITTQGKAKALERGGNRER